MLMGREFNPWMIEAEKVGGKNRRKHEKLVRKMKKKMEYARKKGQTVNDFGGVLNHG